MADAPALTDADVARLGEQRRFAEQMRSYQFPRSVSFHAGLLASTFLRWRPKLLGRP